MNTVATERSVLQWVTPDGNCLKGGQGKRGNHRSLIWQNHEPQLARCLADMNSAAEVDSDSEIEGAR